MRNLLAEASKQASYVHSMCLSTAFCD